MSDNVTQARPYARAAFELARENDSLDAWSAMLAEAARLTADERVHRLIHDPRRAARDKGNTLVELLGELVPERGANFLMVLARQQRLDALAAMSELFEAEREAHEQRISVEIISAYPLDQAQQDKLAQALEKRLNREITITTSVDETLLGGVVIRAGDTVIDGSARGRLNRLASLLNH
ncbi:F0F1 ATP synthase subunit delta [Kushneria aurantia]|uniref:ATP synthase subunit delta n=1 Tax=Kushneria aurantia TaxID=504092 RepID=A0ABV6G0D2_9GAMM|nr:F0F1 ATP synthase subunit delta [Kushneria aurantia]